MKTKVQIEKRMRSLVKDYLIIYKDYTEMENKEDVIFCKNLEGHLRVIMSQIKMLTWVTGLAYKRYFPKEIIIYGN